MALTKNQWHVSTFSGANGSCVEVRQADDGVDVRDTKNRSGGTIHPDRSAWAEFIDGVRDGEFDLDG